MCTSVFAWAKTDTRAPLERPRYLRGAYIMNHKKLLLTLTLCLCALLCMVVTASASEVQEHSHPVCGKTHIDIGDHTGTCEDVTWTAWDGTSEITYDSETKIAYIYLAGNVEISDALTIPQGHTLYLCLNDHSITKTSEDYDESHNRSDANGVIDGSAGNVTFALCNCKTNGTITHTSGKNGRGVWVKGTFIMYGGAISGNNCVYGEGGGVYVYGTFTMYGGTIKENKSTSANGSGGVDANCRTFAMYGGTITGNEAVNGWGGGISLNMGYSHSGVKAIISGGAITNNKAADMGGGIHIANGTLALSGDTTITGNTCGADSHGGGVSTYQATIELASKDVTIENNKNGSGAQANLYLRSKASYTEPSYISVTGDLGSKVFTLTTEKTPTVGNPVTISPYPYCDAGVLNAQNFKYENNDQVSIAVIPTGGKECLKACIHSFTKTSTASKYLKSSATCTSEAVYYKSCACGLASSTETFTSGAIDPENHALVHHEAQAPTCTAVGWEAYDTCSRCTYTTYREIPAAHTYGAVSYTWATDNTTCKAEHKCTACQHVENETVNTQKQVTQNRSCTLNELSTFTATFTNPAFAQQIKENVKTADMTGHTYSATEWESNVDNHWHECSACHTQIDKAEHTWKDATYTAPKTCTVCGATTGTKLSAYYYYSPAKTEDTPVSPKAGDPGVLLYAGLALTSLAGLACTAKKRH